MVITRTDTKNYVAMLILDSIHRRRASLCYSREARLLQHLHRRVNADDRGREALSQARRETPGAAGQVNDPANARGIDVRGNLGHPLLENRRAMIVAAVVGLGNGW